MMKRLSQAVLAATLACAAVAGPARADCTFELFGSAVLTGGAVEATSNFSDADPSNNFGGLALIPEPGTQLQDLESISVEADYTDDGVGGGSPRLVIGLDTDANGTANGHVTVNIADWPGFQDPANLLDPEGEVDATQFGLGYPEYQDLVNTLGGATVTDLFLVVDGGWADTDGEQTVLFDNFRVTINGETCVFVDADDDDVEDSVDHCRESILGGNVDVNGTAPGATNVPNITNANGMGCSIQDLVEECRAHAKNHGQFVSCITQLANDLYAAGTINKDQRKTLQQAAAHSSVGKK